MSNPTATKTKRVHSDDDTLDWKNINARKPNFTEKAHIITYTSRHCRNSNSTSTRKSSLYRIYQMILNPISSCMEHLDLWLNELLIYILPTHYYTHCIKNLFIICNLAIVLPVYVYYYYYDNNNDQCYNNRTQCYNTTGTNFYSCIIACIILLLIWIYYNRWILYHIILQHRRVTTTGI